MRDWPRVLGVATVVAILAAVALVNIFHWILPLNRHRVSVNALPLLAGEATAESVPYQQASEGNPVRDPVYHVRFKGKEYVVEGRSEARPGDRVLVDYRVDKSGTDYVEAIGGVVKP
jgi:hypothetical protein